MRTTRGFVPFWFVLCVLLRCEAVSQRELRQELRGVYLTTSNKLDWPTSLDLREQQASLRKILTDMKAAHLNALFFQVRPRGDAYYNSNYEPWAEHLTGTLGNDPGWDPLAFVLEEAHQLGIEVHAWVNVFKIRGQMPLGAPAPGSRKHPSRAYPEWTVYYDKEVWLNPGLPHARAYTLRVVMDIVKRYDIDGICFDFIRYPGKEFADKEAFRWYGDGKSLADWRRDNVSAFVREAYKAIISVKPKLKVGAAPVGNYKGSISPQPNGNTIGGAFDWYYQDAPRWLKNGWLDYLAPQVYWALAFNAHRPDFAYVARSWQKNSHGRHIYISIGAYKPDIFVQIAEQITSSRAVGAQGQIYFRHQSVAGMNVFGDRYAEPAVTPAMPWKNALPSKTEK